MTTIAFDGKVLAADRRKTLGHGIIRSGTKLYDCGEFVFGSCGDAAHGVVVAEWLKAGRPAEHPKLDDDCVFGIAIRKSDRAIFQVEDEQFVLVQLEDAQHAVGSGRDFALSAMALGMTAPQAIEFAARFDAGTGNGVDVYEFS